MSIVASPKTINLALQGGGSHGAFTWGVLDRLLEKSNLTIENIGGTPYWDGGYTGNPAIFPLIYNCESPDVVLVQITPLTRRGTPETPTEIINRLNEISFNAAIIGEMHAIALAQRVIEEDNLKKRWLKDIFRIFRSILRPIFRVKAWNRSKGFVIGYRYVSVAKGRRNSEAARLKNMNMHVISAEDQMRELDALSKLNASMDFLLHLKEIGRKAADAWLMRNWQMIGEGSSVDIRQMFLD